MYNETTAYISKLEEEIISKRNMYTYLLNSIEEIGKKNEKYKASFKKAELDSLITLAQSSVKPEDLDTMIKTFNLSDSKNLTCDEQNVVRFDLAKLSKEILELKEKKEQAITKLLQVSFLSVSEVIAILKVYNYHYQAIRIGNKTFLAPIDTVVLNTIGDGKAIDSFVFNNMYNNDDNIHYENNYYGNRIANARVVSTYRKDANILEKLNEVINTLAKSKTKVIQEPKKNLINNIMAKFKAKKITENIGYDLQNMPIFIKTKAGIKLNSKVLTIIPKEELESILNEVKNIYWEEIIASHKITPNNRLTELLPAMKISDFEGIAIYLPSKDGVKFNNAVLNVLPPEVLNFILNYIDLAFANEYVSLNTILAKKREAQILEEKERLAKIRAKIESTSIKYSKNVK